MIALPNTMPVHLFAAIMVAASATIYGFGYLHREISFARSFWKTLPALMMAGFAIYFRASPLLAAAMLLCALGDYFLSRGQHRFIPGLIAFLAGHIVYIALFGRLISGLTFDWTMALIILYSCIFAAYLWRAAGQHRWPVLAYIAVITAMAGISFMLPPAYFLTVTGVIAFVFSDSVLAVRMFVVRDQRVKLILSWAVWVSYIAGQSLILIGVVGAT